MARPTKYNAEYHVPWIKGLAQKGYTVKEIARDIGVAVSTVSKWIAENEELSDAIKKGRRFADSQVEMSLYQRAIGCKITKKRTVRQGGTESRSLPVSKSWKRKSRQTLPPVSFG